MNWSANVLCSTHNFQKKYKLVIGEKSECILGCSKHLEYKILRGMNKAKSRITTLNTGKMEFELLRDLLGRILREIALEVKRAWENCLIFTASLLRAQEQSIAFFILEPVQYRPLRWSESWLT